MMSDAIRRHVITECEGLTLNELNDYIKVAVERLSKTDPGDFDFAVILTILNYACEVRDSKVRNMKPRRKI